MTIAISVEIALTRCATTTTWAQGMCGQFCAAMYGWSASGYVDAIAQWKAVPAALKVAGSSDAPPGALIFWGGGSQNHGHVVIAIGDGTCYSIDIDGPGRVTRASVARISQQWGLPLLGWSAPYFQGEQWSPMGIYGVDVSNFQPINFALTTPGDNKPVSFAIIKVTEGATWTASHWTGQRQWAKDHDLSTGFYHFARPGNMIEQADRFLALVDPEPGDHLWFDWEDAGVTNAQKDAWISYVQGRAAGICRVGLYCNTTFWKTRDTTSFAGDGLWIATGGIPAGQPPISSAWLIHQYSTAGDYDHNLAQFATKEDMITWAQGEDMALTAAELKLLTETRNAVLNVTSLVDGKVHQLGYYAAKGEQTLKAALSQSQSNGGGISELKAALTAANGKLDTIAGVLASVDLSQIPAEVAAKIEKLKLIVTVTEEV